jgi:hypothetical protein
VARAVFGLDAEFYFLAPRISFGEICNFVVACHLPNYATDLYIKKAGPHEARGPALFLTCTTYGVAPARLVTINDIPTSLPGGSSQNLYSEILPPDDRQVRYPQVAETALSTYPLERLQRLDERMELPLARW